MATAEAARARRKHVPPEVDSDFYKITDVLDFKDRAVLERVRAFMETEIEPIIEEHWAKAEFPFHTVAGLRDLSIGELATKVTGALAARWC
jgi:glutaryl-CoA dehydrogenase